MDDYENFKKRQSDIIEKSQEGFTSIIDKYVCLSHGLPSPEVTTNKSKTVRCVKRVPSNGVLIGSLNPLKVFERYTKSAGPTVSQEELAAKEEVDELLRSRKVELGLPKDLALCELDINDLEEELVKTHQPQKYPFELEHLENNVQYRTRSKHRNRYHVQNIYSHSGLENNRCRDSTQKQRKSSINRKNNRTPSFSLFSESRRGRRKCITSLEMQCRESRRGRKSKMPSQTHFEKRRSLPQRLSVKNENLSRKRTSSQKQCSDSRQGRTKSNCPSHGQSIVSSRVKRISKNPLNCQISESNNERRKIRTLSEIHAIENRGRRKKSISLSETRSSNSGRRKNIISPSQNVSNILEHSEKLGNPLVSKTSFKLTAKGERPKNEQKDTKASPIISRTLHKYLCITNTLDLIAVPYTPPSNCGIKFDKKGIPINAICAIPLFKNGKKRADTIYVSRKAGQLCADLDVESEHNIYREIPNSLQEKRKVERKKKKTEVTVTLCVQRKKSESQEWKNGDILQDMDGRSSKKNVLLEDNETFCDRTFLREKNVARSTTLNELISTRKSHKSRKVKEIRLNQLREKVLIQKRKKDHVSRGDQLKYMSNTIGTPFFSKQNKDTGRNMILLNNQEQSHSLSLNKAKKLLDTKQILLESERLPADLIFGREQNIPEYIPNNFQGSKATKKKNNVEAVNIEQCFDGKRRVYKNETLKTGNVLEDLEVIDKRKDIDSEDIEKINECENVEEKETSQPEFTKTNMKVLVDTVNQQNFPYSNIPSESEQILTNMEDEDDCIFPSKKVNSKSQRVKSSATRKKQMHSKSKHVNTSVKCQSEDTKTDSSEKTNNNQGFASGSSFSGTSTDNFDNRNSNHVFFTPLDNQKRSNSLVHCLKKKVKQSSQNLNSSLLSTSCTAKSISYDPKRERISKFNKLDLLKVKRKKRTLRQKPSHDYNDFYDSVPMEDTNDEYRLPVDLMPCLRKEYRTTTSSTGAKYPIKNFNNENDLNLSKLLASKISKPNLHVPINTQRLEKEEDAIIDAVKRLSVISNNVDQCMTQEEESQNVVISNVMAGVSNQRDNIITTTAEKNSQERHKNEKISHTLHVNSQAFSAMATCDLYSDESSDSSGPLNLISVESSLPSIGSRNCFISNIEHLWQKVHQKAKETSSGLQHGSFSCTSVLNIDTTKTQASSVWELSDEDSYTVPEYAPTGNITKKRLPPPLEYKYVKR
ncbi:hypothetical protein SK128_012999, partial [Halocaridina rubra]